MEFARIFAKIISAGETDNPRLPHDRGQPPLVRFRNDAICFKSSGHSIRTLQFGRRPPITRMLLCVGQVLQGVVWTPSWSLSLLWHRSINFHAVLGLWDTEVFDLLGRVFVKTGLLSKDSIIADVGSNIGYYALWFGRIATSGRVYAFEPNPDALAILQSNLDLNNAGNVEAVDYACGDRVGEVEFFLAEHHHCSSLDPVWARGGKRECGRITAPITTLDEFFGLDGHHGIPAFIKIDIEGGGTAALPGCRKLFREHRPFVLIESHTPAEDRAISDVLCAFDYCAWRLNDHSWVGNPGETHPDPAGVWGTMLLFPAEHAARISSLLDD